MLKKLIQRPGAITEALSLLPDRMASDEAIVMLLAIGLQESRFQNRRQLVGNPPRPTGPAKSFWQAEQGGGMVRGLLNYHSDYVRDLAIGLIRERGASPDSRSVWDAIEHDDVLAAGLARLLLWTDPKALPALNDVDGAWQLYLRTWRPGAYTRGTAEQKAALRKKWGGYYAQAMREASKCSA